MPSRPLTVSPNVPKYAGRGAVRLRPVRHSPGGVRFSRDLPPVVAEKRGHHERTWGLSASADEGHDPRISQLFQHLRELIDILEQITLHPYSAPVQSKAAKGAPPPPPTLDTTKLAYTVKELRKLIGISHSKVYQAMKNKELRAVKCGDRTLVMAKDLRAWINAWPERR